VFASATESFARRNLNRGLDEQYVMFEPVMARARDAGMRVRAYVSMCFGDPWEGDVPVAQVVGAARRLVDLGASQVSLGDTIGVGTPGQVARLVDVFDAAGVDRRTLAVHFHDTYGQALSNTLAALEHGVATPRSGYPVRTHAVLSGVQLRNASDESCGGSLTQSFVHSCNSVFAPLGAKVGARRLVAAAERFGFGERPKLPGAKASTISPPAELKDSLAVGAAAIGQDRDLATPLAMASVGATIALDGRRVRPRIATLEPVVRRRVVKARTARQVRDMMVGVVRSGTGTAAAIPGVSVAGKTGTAELRPNSTDPKDADAWFVAFAPAERPKVAVAVMLVGAGFGGTAAAPIAREVLQAAL
jgi:hypothetical protein